MVGTAEVLVPLMKPLQGTLFMDMGSDLDTGSSVIGDPAGARGKPGRWVYLPVWAVGLVVD